MCAITSTINTEQTLHNPKHQANGCPIDKELDTTYIHHAISITR